MKTYINQFGETVTKWSSHKHPDNPDYMQLVNWIIWEKPDGRVSIGYNLGALSKTQFIYNMSKDQAIKLYSDNE